MGTCDAVHFVGNLHSFIYLQCDAPDSSYFCFIIGLCNSKVVSVSTVFTVTDFDKISVFVINRGGTSG